MSPFLAEAPGGDTLLDVHPTQLQEFRKVCIPLNPIYLEGDEGRAKRRISARSESERGRRCAAEGSRLYLQQKKTKCDF